MQKFIPISKALEVISWDDLKIRIMRGQVFAQCKVNGRTISLKPQWLEYTVSLGNPGEPLPESATEEERRALPVQTTDAPTEDALFFERRAGCPHVIASIDVDILDIPEILAIWEPSKPACNAIIDPQQQPVSDDKPKTAGNTSNAQAEYQQWLEANGYEANGARRVKKVIVTDFMKRFPGTQTRTWNKAFGAWAGTARQPHRPRKVNKKVNN